MTITLDGVETVLGIAEKAAGMLPNPEGAIAKYAIIGAEKLAPILMTFITDRAADQAKVQADAYAAVDALLAAAGSERDRLAADDKAAVAEAVATPSP